MYESILPHLTKRANQKAPDDGLTKRTNQEAAGDGLAVESSRGFVSTLDGVVDVADGEGALEGNVDDEPFGYGDADVVDDVEEKAGDEAGAPRIARRARIASIANDGATAETKANAEGNKQGRSP